MIPNKAHLRRGILIHRESLPPASVEKIGDAFATRLWAIPLWQRTRFPALYVSMGGEASTRRILEEIFREGRAVALPRVEGSELRWHRVDSMDGLAYGRFGILEPKPDLPAVADTEPDLIIVPGVVFDRRGGRVGYGKGYYDRFLARSKAPTLALAYGFQVVHQIPEEAHDRRMDLILTPTELIDCRATPAG